MSGAGQVGEEEPTAWSQVREGASRGHAHQGHMIQWLPGGTQTF